MKPAQANKALRNYTQAFLQRNLPCGSLFDYAISLLSKPGLVLSDTPHSALPCAVILCYAMVSDDDVNKVLPAAAAVDLTLTAFEVYDKFVDREGWGEVMPQPGILDLNLATCFQSLATTTLDELRERGFPHSKVLGAHLALANTVVEYCAVADHDVRMESCWLGLEEALSLVVGKGAGAGSWVGTLGAHLASDDTQVVAACTEFGRNLGAYSQIVNDLNDAMPYAILKSDVRARKSTLPLVYFLSLPDDNYEEAKDLLRGNIPLSLEQEVMIRKAVESSGCNGPGDRYHPPGPSRR